MLKPYNFIGSLLMLSIAGLSLFSSVTYGQTARTEPVAFTPPTLSVAADPLVVTTCASDTTQAIVHLIANGTSTRGNPTHYVWQTSGGKIQGDGATVTWDLAGLTPGYYTAFLDVKSGSSNEQCEAFSSTTVV